MIHFFMKYHFEWIVFLAGLLLIGMMNPYIDNGSTLCLLDAAGFPFCPGEGLGHSIAFTFRGDFSNALTAHPFGPAAILIMSGRICYLWKRAFQQINSVKNKN